MGRGEVGEITGWTRNPSLTPKQFKTLLVEMALPLQWMLSKLKRRCMIYFKNKNWIIFLSRLSNSKTKQLNCINMTEGKDKAVSNCCLFCDTRENEIKKHNWRITSRISKGHVYTASSMSLGTRPRNKSGRPLSLSAHRRLAIQQRRQLRGPASMFQHCSKGLSRQSLSMLLGHVVRTPPSCLTWTHRGHKGGVCFFTEPGYQT